MCRPGYKAAGDGVRQHTLLSVSMNEGSNIATPTSRLRGEHRDTVTVLRVPAVLNSWPCDMRERTATEGPGIYCGVG
jgi:hypothetical protein